jgi:hypothetical protein
MRSVSLPIWKDDADEAFVVILDLFLLPALLLSARRRRATRGVATKTFDEPTAEDATMQTSRERKKTRVFFKNNTNQKK